MMSAYVPDNIPIFFNALDKTLININELLTVRFYDFREIFPYSYLKEKGFTLSAEEISKTLEERLGKLKAMD
jgi:hypothetical protein